MTLETTHTNGAIATLIEARQAALHKTDQELARDAGFAAASAITLIKAGKMKLQLSRIQSLAKALEVPAHDVLEAALADYMPDVLELLQAVWQPTSLTESEEKMLAAYRQLAGDRDVSPVVLDGKHVIALVSV